MEQEPKLKEPCMSLSETIDELERLDKEFHDEIPSEIIRGNSEDKNWKVRRNWWQGIVAILEVANEHLNIQFHSEIMNEIDQFINDYTGYYFAGRLTTKEDIDRANKITRKVIEVLKNLQN